MPGDPIAEVPLEDFNESNNILVHSFPGMGKTVFGASAPNCTLVSCEPGAISAKRQGSTAALVRLKSWGMAKLFLTAVEAGKFDHRDWLVIDTLSTLQVRNMNEVVDKAYEDSPAKRDPDIPAIPDYQKNQNSLKRWVERLVDYPINCLFLAHTMRVSNDDGDVLFLPSIQGGPDKGYPVSNYIMGLMNAVGYMEVRSVKDGEKVRRVRRIRWQPYHNLKTDERISAKDQYDALGLYTDDWSMEQIVKAITASGTEDVKPVKRATRRAAAK